MKRYIHKQGSGIGDRGSANQAVPCPLFLVLGFVLAVVLPAHADILTSKHNLSSSGPGEAGITRATDQAQVCIFCHVPHHSTSVTPLWSRDDPDPTGVGYTPYRSLSLENEPGQPRGGSRLCLSCHDGTVALGMLAEGRQISTLDRLPVGRPSNLTRDLSDDHPISIPYTDQVASDDGELLLPHELPMVLRLEDGEYLECRTCHDPHDDSFGHFLVMSNQGSALCTACHRKSGWAESVHALDPALAAAGCDNCHLPHNAGGLWLNVAGEEQVCLPCHSDTLVSDLSGHPVDSSATTGEHEPDEDPLTAPTHVECTDCHNPHAASGAGALSPDGVTGALRGVRGVDKDGIVVDPATYEYEVCFRCHAENSFVAATAVTRQVEEVDQSLRFETTNPAFHPVLAPRNAGIPGLLPGYTQGSLVRCTDCHGNSRGTLQGGTGANGPHNSGEQTLLIARYVQATPPVAYLESNYELCFRCHDSLDLFGAATGGTNFHDGAVNRHWSHVNDHEIPCSVCHDPHGIPSQPIGVLNDTDFDRLINFDVDVVDPLTAVFDYSLRSCTVSCHTPATHSY